MPAVPAVAAAVAAAAAGVAPRAVGERAARLARLAACKRFEMAWMFAGGAEKTAVTEMLSAGQGAAEVDAAELATAAKRYGVKLA